MTETNSNVAVTDVPENNQQNEIQNGLQSEQSVVNAELNETKAEESIQQTQTQPEEAVSQADSILTQSEELGIDKRIARSLAEIGFEKLTPIQEQTIPLLLQGRDVLGQAQTGTGKTAAFGIPLLQNIDPENKNVQAIVLCPTRELAVQAAEELRKFAKYMFDLRVLPIYGGQDISRQIRALKNVQVVVGTPGRVMDHMRRHTLKLEHISMLVLDEADEMLNMGFREDIEDILKEVPGERQTALFSATMPKAILDITHTYQKADAVNIRVTPKELTIPLVKQYYYEVSRGNKEEVTARLLDYYNPKRSLIFCNTKKMVDELAEHLKGRGYQAEGLHGDLSQMQRDRVMNGFRSGMVEILIATDVAARGIDVDDVEAVLNFDVPQDIEYYVHRIGRTGRAGKKGRSFTLVVGRDIYKLRDIERTCKTTIEARRVPSATDVISAKADKVLSQVLDIYKEQDLTGVLPIIEQKLNDEDLTAIELAAAFLKLHMGEAPEEIQEPEKRSRGGRDGRSGEGRSYGSRDGRGSRDGGRSYGSRDGRGSRDGGRSYGSGDGRGSRDGGRSYGNGDGRGSRDGGRSYGSGDGRGSRDGGRSYGSGESRSYAGSESGYRKARGDGRRADAVRSTELREGEERPKKLNADGSPYTKKTKTYNTDAPVVNKRRHSHDEDGVLRQKKITGDNRDYGYEADSKSYRGSSKARPVEIKTKDEHSSARRGQDSRDKKPGFFTRKK